MGIILTEIWNPCIDIILFNVIQSFTVSLGGISTDFTHWDFVF